MSFRFDRGRAGDSVHVYLAMRENHRGNLSIFDRSVFNFAVRNTGLFDATDCLIDNVEDIREILSRIFNNYSCDYTIKSEVRDELYMIDVWIEAIEYMDTNDSGTMCRFIREYEV